ncbi:WD40 repeat [Amycolatopsis xylanica]|uniref:WD40 repeat n=1 Tax=Amycolatopsis xylanica TaxID=589385 RepID=A0A1H2SYF8_9PSEU|nr:hypothetical protein [Amycolatopsis xylanica]SDW36505.1 WD40 repeat [Amycolatopsis xylanica]
MPRPENPIHDVHGELTAFAADLRRLRERAGSPTYRSLAARSGYSATALSQAAAGRKLPTLAVTLAFVTACEGDPADWEFCWREVSDVLSDKGTTASQDAAPYVGLACFQAADADRYFGRDLLVEELRSAVADHRLVGVFGASGTGKSSLLRAGLLAQLQVDGRPALLFTPGERPLDECAAQIAAVTGQSVAQIRAEFDTGPDALPRILADQVRELVMVVDQFEEVFTLCSDPVQRDWFVRAVVLAAAAEGADIRVVLGTRADFYGHCGQYPQLVEALRGAQVLIGPMGPDDIREAITGPALQAGNTVETALVSRLVADAVGQPGVLPLLSHALLQTWRRRSGMTLTLAGYEQTGGIEHALARTAEHVYRGFDDEEQDLARHLFLRLTALGEGTEDTKRRVSRRELDADPQLEGVLNALAAARLLSLGEDTAELAHEALIRHWPRLRDWLNEDREGLRVHRHLTQATDDWEFLERDAGALYRGVRLATAHDWAAQHRRAITARERAFLRASRRADRRRTRRLVLLLIAAVVVMITARDLHSAAAQHNLVTARDAVDRAIQLEKSNSSLALRLKLAAYKLAATPETTSTLLNAFATPYASRLDLPAGKIMAFTFTRNGTVTATASDDGVVRLWDTGRPEQPRLLTTMIDIGKVTSLEFSPDGRVMLSTNEDLTTWLWRTDDLSHPVRVQALGNGTSGVFSSNGKSLAVHRSGQIQLWNLADPSSPVQWGALPGTSATFSPDGQLLAVTTESGGRLWDVSDARQPRPLQVFPFTATGASVPVFSPDGQTLAVDNTGVWTLWDITDPANLRQLSTIDGGHILGFSPDGKTAATNDRSQAGRSVRLWDLSDRNSPRQTHSLDYHVDRILGLRFSADGRWITSLTTSSILALDRAGLPLTSPTGSAMTSATFLSDGRTLLVGEQGSARLWNVADFRHPSQLSTIQTSRPDNRTTVFSAAVTDSGSVLLGGNQLDTQIWNTTEPARPRRTATLTGAGEVRALSNQGILATNSAHHAQQATEPSPQLWDAIHGLKLSTLPTTADIGSAAFANRVPILATVSSRGDAELWDLSDPQRPFQTGTLPVRAVVAAINRDDQLLTAGPDASVRLWTIADPHQPTLVAQFDTASPVTAGALSPDGHTVALGGKDGTTSLWSIANPQKPPHLATLAGHTDEITDVHFSSDGYGLVTTSLDGTARLWNTDTTRIIEEICRTLQPMTVNEWHATVPDLPYTPTCT